MDESIIAAKYPIGSKPHRHFIPYLVFISYIVSFIGAFTTVELLHRRISGTGWRSWLQLGACSVSFGLVAIWCMHFVGNRAIVLGDGEDAIQLYYSATFTAVSAILPIVVIFLGLMIADRFYKNHKHSAIRYVALFFCGVCTGAAVTEMHYLGNQGTTNYHLDPNTPYIVGAAAIAVGACLIAFGLFFHWSRHWVNYIGRRIVIAFFLAGAVSGMHWTAAAGTEYELRGYHVGPGRERNVNLIIAVCLCLAACVVCFIIGFIKQRQQKRLRDRAQQVVLAVATFDEDGKLLVTPGGLLPCQTITQQFHQRTFDEDFNTGHPVFQWLFRVSRHWGGIIDLIPAMRDHLLSTGYLQTHTPVMSNAGRSSIDTENDTNYSATFRELFCVTAEDIAKTLQVRLQDLGCLYEDVLTTGTLSTKPFFRDTHGKTIMAADVSAEPKDVESGLANPILFGRGQLLVLTRRIGTPEANRLQNAGYRFGSMEQIGDQLARSMQIPREDLGRLVTRLQKYCEREPLVPTEGTYLGSFLLQPSPVLRGLEVIVPSATPDRLPMVKLSTDALGSKQLKLLSTFNGMTLDDCLARLAQRTGSITEDDVFLEKFRNKIRALTREVPEPDIRHSIFSSQQLDIAHGLAGQDTYQATMFAFCGIKEVYSQSLQSSSLRCVPLSFFRAALRTYAGCPDHAILAHKNHKEFSALLHEAIDAQAAATSTKTGSKWATFFRGNDHSTSEAAVHPDSSSEKGLVPLSPLAGDTPSLGSHPFGGIMVSQDVVISQDKKYSSQMEMRDLGVRAEAGVAETEEQLTMADRLMSITTSFRDPHTRALIRENYDRR